MYRISKDLEIEFDYSPFFERMKKLGKSPSTFLVENGFSSNFLKRMELHMSMTLVTMYLIMKSAGIKDPHDFVIVRTGKPKEKKSGK